TDRSGNLARHFQCPCCPGTPGKPGPIARSDRQRLATPPATPHLAVHNGMGFIGIRAVSARANRSTHRLSRGRRVRGTSMDAKPGTNTKMAKLSVGDKDYTF